MLFRDLLPGVRSHYRGGLEHFPARDAASQDELRVDVRGIPSVPVPDLEYDHGLPAAAAVLEGHLPRPRRDDPVVVTARHHEKTAGPQGGAHAEERDAKVAGVEEVRERVAAAHDHVEGVPVLPGQLPHVRDRESSGVEPSGARLAVAPATDLGLISLPVTV